MPRLSTEEIEALLAKAAPRKYASSEQIRARVDLESNSRYAHEELVEARKRIETLTKALESADEWLTELGCDCGTDEPGTCAFCVVRAALFPTVAPETKPPSVEEFCAHCPCAYPRSVWAQDACPMCGRAPETPRKP